MTPPPLDRHRRLRAIFDEAVLKETAAREGFLDEACAGDADLRTQVRRLLAVHEQPDFFLDKPLDVSWTTRDDAEFAGTDRFRVLRKLGTGGMGVVYEVHDTLRDETVALKTLRRTGAADLYRLKREFRSLADIAHPNLVCLYELFVEADRSFFTMELVRGGTFVDYARSGQGDRVAIDRLIPALAQLIDGVAALHRRGKLHRDIKPSNVLVTGDGRVVILDFGIIADMTSRHGADAIRGGTPAYLSPEEAAGQVPSEASDWYGVGATLYEALTGVLPFSGTVTDVLERKQTADPPAPVDLFPEAVPPDLSAISMGLLHREPEKRLDDRAVRRALKREVQEPQPAIRAAAPDMSFVGRHRELQVLNDARQQAEHGGVRAVAIYGPSGIGKSALVRQFLDNLNREAVVLAGRCYENESVPYKGLDGVVDSLSRYLASNPPEHVRDLLPRDVSALTRVFPVLLQVEAIAQAVSARDPEQADPFRIRRRAFEALSAMLTQLASRQLLVIWIDDLQWADTDSIAVLDELLGSSNPPAMLTLLSFRREELAAKPFLQDFIGRAKSDSGHAATTGTVWGALSLDPMTDDEAHALIESVLPDGAAVLTADEKERLARDAGGSPFVLEQLALYTGERAREMGQTPTFAHLFESRVDTLPPSARLFLETLAICGRPVEPEIVCDASGVARDRQSLVVTLRASRLIRSSGSSDRIETYHDRIREVLAGRLAPAAIRDIHVRMAEALTARHSDDCEALFAHYRGAEDHERAAVQASLAAERASHTLAFDRAASFYRHALDLTPSASDAHGWRAGLAAALANAGRPAEAADAFLQAADGATRSQRIALQRRAAEQLLIGGHMDRGLDLMKHALQSLGMTMAPNPRMAAIRIVWRRARLYWRGLDFATRTQSEIDDETLMRLDTCWATATGLALVDITALDFIAQHLHMALEAGEPSRIARGLALESAARNADWTFRRSAPALAARGRVLAERVGTPHAIAMERLTDAISATAVGEWRRALISGEEATAIFKDQCVGVTWELNIAQNAAIWGLMYMGELVEVSRRVPALLADGRRRGNHYLATELCTRSNFVWLAADDPDEGEREATAAIARWSQKGFHRQHYSARLARVQTALYRGDAEAAWRLFNEDEAKFRRSMLRNVQTLRVEAEYLQARCAIAIAVSRDDRRFLSIARGCARRIARERMPWSNPLGLLLQGAIASVEGHDAAAIEHLEDAVAGFDYCEMNLYAAVTRRRLGALRRDDRGRQLREQSATWMAGQQIRNPICWARMFAPGFPNEGSSLFLSDDRVR